MFYPVIIDYLFTKFYEQDFVELIKQVKNDTHIRAFLVFMVNVEV